MKKYSAFLFLFLSICLYGQNIDIPNIIPPSPTAYELGRYGQVPVGMFTGTPNISIPLYTYTTKNLSVPISLSYNSNGIKVDELSSNVGHGWSLNMGGVITRVVRDKPDEDRGVLIPDANIQELGYRSAEAMNFFFAAGEEDADSETDLYMYNFMGHSGKFVFENKQMDGAGVYRGIVMMPQTDLRVDVLSGGFKVTTADGVIYTFLEREQTKSITIGAGHQLPYIVDSAWYLTKIEHPKGDYIDFIYEEDTTGFTYDASITESVKRMAPHIQTGCNGSIFGSSYAPESITTKVSIYSKRLKEIHSNSSENGKIFIESNISHPEIGSYKMVSQLTVKDKNSSIKDKIDLFYYSTTNNRMLLDSLQFLDSSKNYSFEYYTPDGMPPRLSKSVDYYGYYNGKNNAYRFPDPQDPFIKPYIDFALWNIPDGADKTVDASKAVNGILKKVHYPTKGYNEFEYEMSSYMDEVIHYPGDNTLSLLAISDDMPIQVEDIITTSQIGYNQNADIRYHVDFNTDCPSYHDVDKNKAQLTITDNLGSTDIRIFRVFPNGNSQFIGNNSVVLGSESVQIPPDNHLRVELKENRTYTISLETRFLCTYSSLNFTYSSGTPWTTVEHIPTGNLRLKRIKSYDLPTSSQPENIMRYYYGKRDALEVSSGLEGARPYYVTKSMTRTACGIGGSYSDINYLSLNSNSMRQLYSSSDMGTTYYKYVTVSYGGDNFEGGGIENEYLIMPDVQGNPLFNSIPIDSSPWVNTGWGNGLLKKETVFKKNGTEFTTLRETTNSFVQDPILYKEVFGYSVVKKFDYVGGYLHITYDCTPEDTTQKTKYWFCATDHKHNWLIGGVPGDGIDGTVCISWGRNMQYQWLYHPCYQKDLPYTIIRDDLIENLDIMAYTSNSYWFYQNFSTVKEYDENGNPKAISTTQYHYDNPEHLQPTRTVTTTSDGRQLVTRTEYPHDLPNESYMGDLIDQHRIAEPVRVSTYQDTGTGEELLGTQKTVYDDFGGLYLPKFMQTAKGAEPLQNRLVYSSYDGYGNLREVYRPNGSRTVYVMGYDFTLPVAKLENVAISEIPQSYLDNIYYESKFGTETMLLEKLDDLRVFIGGLDKAALVTTLTYLPLVGVHTVTDPKGNKMTYEYDDFGRLQYVKDMDGNILSENQYRYITD